MTQLLNNRNFQLILAVTLTAVMGVSVLTPVFPQIVEVFNITREQATLLITAFTLPGIFLSPVYGILADRWGRKRVLVPLLLIFGLAGAACGLARNFTLLVALRFLQGIGSGGLFTLNNTLIGDLFDGEDRIRAMGLNASFISSATALYPAIGGALAKISWNLPFFLPILGLVVSFLIIVILPNDTPTSKQALVGYLRSALIHMKSARILKLFGLSFITFALAMGAIISFLPFWMSEKYHSGPEVIGIILSVSSLSGAITASNLAYFRRKMTVRTMLIIAFATYVVSFVLIPNSVSVWWILIPGVLYGAAQGINIPTVQTVLIGLAPVQYRGAFMAINSTVILLGISLGPVLAALAYNRLGLVGLYYASAVVSGVFALILIVSGMWIRNLPTPGILVDDLPR